MARGRSFRPRQSARLTQWIGPAIQDYNVVAAGGATLVASIPFEGPVTVMRTRGHVSIIPESTAADVHLIGAFGAGIVTAEAFGAGIASMPEPFTDADWGGWLVWRTFSYGLEFETAASVGFPNWNFEIDSKAMRKVGPDDNIVTISSEAGAVGARLFTGGRTLIQLH